VPRRVALGVLVRFDNYFKAVGFQYRNPSLLV